MENYKEKLKLAKEALESGSYDKETIEYIFPELAESEDERIRKWIVKELESKYVVDNKVNNLEADKALAWLEKQGEYKETLCDKCRREQPSHSCQDITELGRCALEHQSKQKPTDKVEPKFKAGDFIANGRRVLLVLANKEERNLGETYSTYCEGLVLDVYGNVLVDDKDFSGFRLATDIERANFVHDLKVGTKINYKPAWSEEDKNCEKISEYTPVEKDMDEYNKGFECGKQRVLKYPEDNTLLLIRCPKCGRENYAPNVISGICCWCGYSAWELVKKK